MFAALALVLGLFALFIYGLKRFGVTGWSGQAGELRIERFTSVGYRSRVAIIRASGQRYLIGVTPHSIQRIAELPSDAEPPPEPETGDSEH